MRLKGTSTYAFAGASGSEALTLFHDYIFRRRIQLKHGYYLTVVVRVCVCVWKGHVVIRMCGACRSSCLKLISLLSHK